jgi:signal peptidase I
MGDNRDHSADSRFSLAEQGLGGPVPIENIGGRAEFITFSLDGTTGLNPATWLSSFRDGRAGSSLRPPREYDQG